MKSGLVGGCTLITIIEFSCTKYVHVYMYGVYLQLQWVGSSFISGSFLRVCCMLYMLYAVLRDLVYILSFGCHD